MKSILMVRYISDFMKSILIGGSDDLMSQYMPTSNRLVKSVKTSAVHHERELNRNWIDGTHGSDR